MPPSKLTKNNKQSPALMGVSGDRVFLYCNQTLITLSIEEAEAALNELPNRIALAKQNRAHGIKSEPIERIKQTLLTLLIGSNRIH